MGPEMRLPLRTATLALAATLAFAPWPHASGATREKANAKAVHADVLFVHVDGASASHWDAARALLAGPDGDLSWDRLPRLALYRAHQADALTTKSTGGGTVHGWGVKVPADSYGMANGKPLVARSGKPVPIAKEAMDAGYAVAVLNSSDVTEPNAGALLAAVADPGDDAAIAAALLAARPDVLMGGGERWFLPKGAAGRHGEGARADGRDLVAEARAAGYTVVSTREELARVPAGTKRLLGLFAHESTFNEATEGGLKALGLPAYQPQAPDLGEMVRASLALLAGAGRPVFVVANEEGSDNFSGVNNASAVFEALRRADAALGVALAHKAAHPATLVLTTADSNASGLHVVGPRPSKLEEVTPVVPLVAENGAPLRGAAGPQSAPFLSAPDREGRRFPFYVSFAAASDGSGGIVARGDGPGSELLAGSIDNTGIYRVLYKALFGVTLP
jgi:alkaline phosphatase